MNMLLLPSPLIRTISVLLLLLCLVPEYISAASLHSNLNSDYYLTGEKDYCTSYSIIYKIYAVIFQHAFSETNQYADF